MKKYKNKLDIKLINKKILVKIKLMNNNLENKYMKYRILVHKLVEMDRLRIKLVNNFKRKVINI